MKNFWLERVEDKATTMEAKIEKMLAPHHVIWLADDTVGKTTMLNDSFTVTSGPQSEWDFNTTMDVNPHSDLSHSYCFDINTYMAEIRPILEAAIDSEFARLVESEGWNLDL